MSSCISDPVQNNRVWPDVVVDEARLVHFIECANNFVSLARHLALSQNRNLRDGHVRLQVTTYHFGCDYEDIGSLSEAFNVLDDVFA